MWFALSPTRTSMNPKWRRPGRRQWKYFDRSEARRMGETLERKEAVALVRQKVSHENLVKHMLAAEPIMAALADRLHEDSPRWALAGLVHDLDVEETAETLEEHGRRSVEWLREAGLSDEEVLQAVLAHNPANGAQVSSIMDRALFAADPLTGLITAAALIRPEKKLEFVKLKSLKKRYKEPSFARGARREDIATCTELGIPLEEFLEDGLEAMKSISGDLGL